MADRMTPANLIEVILIRLCLSWTRPKFTDTASPSPAKLCPHRRSYAVTGEAMPSPDLNRVYRDQGKEEEEKKSQMIVVERVL
jgi:hypothetical protein